MSNHLQGWFIDIQPITINSQSSNMHSMSMLMAEMSVGTSPQVLKTNKGHCKQDSILAMAG